jgi:hypothetical protein
MNKPTHTSLLIMRDGSVVHIARRGVDDTRDHRKVVEETVESVNRLRTLPFKRQQP